MDNTPNSDKCNIPNPSHGMVKIPIEKLIALIQQNLLNSQKKSPLIRAKSDPTSGFHTQGTKRKSIPEVFIFPDIKENSTSDSETPHTSSKSLSIDGRKESNNSGESGSGSESGVPVPIQKQDEYSQKVEIMPLSLSYEERQSSNHGVSEVYFKNVVNELVKTKKCLKDLQAQHKLMVQEKSQNGELKSELQQLRFTAQLLQRELKKVTEQNRKLKLKLSAYQPPGMNESFELGTSGELEFRDKEVQTDPDMIGSTGTMVRIWHQAMEEFRKENVDLTQQYNELKNNVKILNSCLNEEKIKNRNKDKKLNELEMERRSVFSQLSSRRQELDELKQEHVALKKTLNLHEDDHTGHRSQTSGIRSPGRYSSSSSRTSGRSNSGDQIHLNIPPTNQSSYGRQGQYRTSSGNVSSCRNDLSSIDDDERAPSNVALPFSRHNSHGDSVRSVQIQDSSELNVPSEGHGTAETQPHAKLECPACLESKFQNDISYLSHLSKCMP